MAAKSVTAKHASPPGAKTLKLKAVNVRDLIEDEDNANQHPARSIEVLVASLERFGQVEPLVVRKGTNVVIGGNGRLVAMQRMEWETCVVHEYDGTKAECRALSIALNRSAELSDWNLEELEVSLSVLDADQDIDMSVLGFDVNEVNFMFPGDVDDPLGEWDGMPEFENEDQTSFQSIHVHFANVEDVEGFSKLIGQPITISTRSLWHPEAEIGRIANKSYESSE